MKCDNCGRRMDYCFYMEDKYWRKVVGEKKFSKSVGILCGHCALEELGGKDWHITKYKKLTN